MRFARWMRRGPIGLVALLAVVASPWLPTQLAAAQAPDPVAGAEPGTKVVAVQRGGRELQTPVFDPATAPDGRPMRAGSLVVTFRRDAAAATRAAAHQAAGALATRALAAGLERVQVEPSQVDSALAAYRARADVESAEPDYLLRAVFTPNDPGFPDQYGPLVISAPAAWDVTRGSPNVRVAILDSGIYSRHPDLQGKIVLEQNFGPSRFGPDDLTNHGTLVAGIVAASTNNGVGIAGVGFDTALLNGKVTDDQGSATTSAVIAGLRWATDNGARVINLSLGGSGPCPASVQAAIDAAWASGAVLVAAAGNDGVAQSETPGNCQHVLSVAATDRTDARASFSNYGPDVQLAAPGSRIVSTDYVGSYAIASGTSFSAPHVAGVAALVWAGPYGTSPSAVLDRILATADKIPGTGSFWTAGRVNAAAAVGRGATADLVVGLSDAPDPVSTGSAVTYALRATNSGPAAATTVRLILRIPKTAGLAFRSDLSTAGCVLQPDDPVKQFRRVFCDRGALVAGATTSASLVFTAGPAGRIDPIVGKAKLTTAGESDPNPANNRATETTTVT